MQISEPKNITSSVGGKSRSLKIFVAGGVLFVAVFFGAAFYLGWFSGGEPEKEPKERIIRDTVEIPHLTAIRGDEALYLAHSPNPIPIVPAKAQGITVEGAEQTIRGAYDIAVPKAKQWSADAKLIFIKSLGSIGPDGKSSHWEFTFGSKEKKKGFFAIVRGSVVVSEGEANTEKYGYDLPKNWYDSPDAIASLFGLPQFASSMITAMSFHYNQDDKKWNYAIGTSRGNVSMVVK